jgi:hypothetical protein
MFKWILALGFVLLARVVVLRDSAPAVASSSTARLVMAPALALATGNDLGAVMALPPDERFAALADTDNDQVVMVIVDPGNERVGETFPVGAGPATVMFLDGSRVAVAERANHSVSVYAVPGGRRLARLTLTDPYGLARTPDGRTLVVSSGFAGRVAVIDIASFRTRCEVAVRREPRGVFVTPEGTHALVSHVAGEPLSAVDLAQCTAVQLPPVPMHAEETEVWGEWMSQTFTGRLSKRCSADACVICSRRRCDSVGTTYPSKS